MISVDILGPHRAMEVNCTRGSVSKFYMPWKPIDEVVDWLVQHCHGSYMVGHDVEISYEQGIGEMPMFRGLKFIFEDHDEAMLFKLTWV